MNESDRKPIDELIGMAMPDQVPGVVTTQLKSKLAEFRSQLAAAQPSSHGTGAWNRSAWWGWGVAAAAGVAVATIIVLVLRAQTSFAEVAATAFKQPWIHLEQANADGTPSEIWYSPSLAISASRSRDLIEYRDHRLQTYYSYDPKEHVLYRGPDVTRSPFFESIFAAMTVFLKEDRTGDNLLDHLFLGQEREKMKVLDQTTKEVTENGHQWLDYRMTVSHTGMPQPLRIYFRVDVATKLPQLCRIEGEWEGKPATNEIRFDYPENGPADVYDLGVPQNAKLVDRVPAGDLKRIWETLQAGRERMDNYRAVFVMHLESENAWWTDLPIIMYRKGDKFRADYSAGWIGNDSFSKSPGTIEDLSRWWRDRVKSFQFYPQYVMRGSTLYTSTTKQVTDADGSEHEDIVSVGRFDYNSKPGETFPPEYSMRPEFACRPPLGVGGQHFQPVLNMNPTEGPGGCILLSIQHTSQDGRVNDTGVGLPDDQRFWLDPERGYVVMRWDMVSRDEAGKEKLIETDTVEEIAKSPRGIWYATKIRRGFPQTQGENGKQSDQVYHLYVDFDADLPDAFFDPPVPTRSR